MEAKDIDFFETGDVQTLSYAAPLDHYVKAGVPPAQQIAVLKYTRSYSSGDSGNRILTERVEADFVEGGKYSVLKGPAGVSFKRGFGIRLKAMPQGLMDKILVTVTDTAAELLKHAMEEDKP